MAAKEIRRYRKLVPPAPAPHLAALARQAEDQGLFGLAAAQE